MELIEILKSLKLGKITVPQAKKLLSIYSIEQIEDFAKLDIGRKLRRGIPEVIFAEKKQLTEIKKIMIAAINRSDSILMSRINKNDYKKIVLFSKKNKIKVKLGKNTTSVLFFKNNLYFSGGKVGILTAGTSDVGVAEEARLMCEAMGCTCISSYDVGIAGLHRVFPIMKKMIKE